MLTVCRECRREVSTSATSCPHCGAARSSWTPAKLLVGLVAGAGLGIIGLWLLSRVVVVAIR